MGKRGPKRKYQSPVDFERAVNAYFLNCKENGDVFPDLAGMRIYLNVTQRTLNKYIEGAESDDDAAYFRKVLEQAADKRQSWLERRMVTEPRAANGCMNALKQPANGGFVDRAMESGDRSLTINILGVGGVEAFK